MGGRCCWRVRRAGVCSPLTSPTWKRLDLTIMLLSEADAALGRLAGAGRLLPDPHLLVNAYITREAVSSSRIEGTQASVTEIFDATVTGISQSTSRTIDQCS